MAAAQSMSRSARLERFYNILHDLDQNTGAGFDLADLPSQKNLPDRGVYFFFETDELRASGTPMSRVVRVGTHALKAGAQSTIKQRLSQHLGSRSGGGNHRSSIFRLLIGQSWLAKHDHVECPSWGLKGESKKAAIFLGVDRGELIASEAPVEQAVSARLASMRVLVLPVLDAPGAQSDRALIERNSIALLSNYNRVVLDAPSDAWLGQYSDRELVRGSGLWNQRHVDEVDVPDFLDKFEGRVEKTRRVR